MAARAQTFEPLSSRPGRDDSALSIIIFASFLLIGGGISFAFLRDVPKILSARGWEPVSCVIVGSAVAESHAGEGPSYQVELEYAYAFDGQTFRGRRYSFMKVWTEDRARWQSIVDRHPAGSRAVCYVNPRHPSEAVIERGFTSDSLFGLIPISLAVIGAGGLVSSLRKLRQRRQPMAGALAISNADTPAAATTKGPVTLQPLYTPPRRLLGKLVSLALWAGFTWFATLMTQGWRSRNPGLFEMVFGGVWAVVGIRTILGIARHFLALAAPRPKLTMTRGTVRLGESFGLQWEILGHRSWMRRLRIYLEGREEATYQRGTDTVTDRHVFRTIDMVDLTDPVRFASGQVTVTVPGDSMHSFASEHNKIIWEIHVQAEIPVWPDVQERFPLSVLPSS
jgi:hypothetical protein